MMGDNDGAPTNKRVRHDDENLTNDTEERKYGEEAKECLLLDDDDEEVCGGDYNDGDDNGKSHSKNA